MIVDKDGQLMDQINENVTIRNGAVIESHRIINGDVTIIENSTFYMHGILSGNLTVEDGSHAVIYDIMNGNITADGSVEISGILNTNKKVPVKVKKNPGSIVNNKRY